MLEIKGYPLVILAALRAQRSGYLFCIAASDSSQDDVIAHTAMLYGLDVIRGPEDDTLARYVKAVESLDDNDIIVRLTGDNILPDANLIGSIVNEFSTNDLRYMATLWPNDGLPYGVRVEVTYVGELRSINSLELSSYDREHVTPAIIRKYGVTFSDKCVSREHFSYIRATIDNIDDYCRLERVFRNVDDPVRTPWEDIAARLRDDFLEGKVYSLNKNKEHGSCHHDFILGGAQLGMNYGAANKTGKLCNFDAVNLVRSAALYGVTTVDTARAYGDSEQVVGEAFTGGRCNEMTAITKLSPLDTLSSSSTEGEVIAKVDASIFESCAKLGMNQLNVLMLHRASHLTEYDGLIWNRVCHHLEAGIVRKVGVSVQSVEEALLAINSKKVKYLQLPYNLLDSRWEKSGVIEQIKAVKNKITIHVRSVFLQGLLCSTNFDDWPKLKGLNIAYLAGRLGEISDQLNRDGIDDLAIAYVRSHDWIDGVVIGIETENQLKRNLQIFTNKPLTQSEAQKVRTFLPSVPEDLLDPSRWIFE
tara:strand:+ start:97374 stop:98969 length:1596 start_codon:yes stop_codon:yes gene_type:complete